MQWAQLWNYTAVNCLCARSSVPSSLCSKVVSQTWQKAEAERQKLLLHHLVPLIIFCIFPEDFYSRIHFVHVNIWMSEVTDQLAAVALISPRGLTIRSIHMSKNVLSISLLLISLLLICYWLKILLQSPIWIILSPSPPDYPDKPTGQHIRHCTVCQYMHFFKYLVSIGLGLNFLLYLILIYTVFKWVKVNHVPNNPQHQDWRRVGNLS